MSQVRVDDPDQRGGALLTGLRLPYGRERLARAWIDARDKDPNRPTKYHSAGEPGTLPRAFSEFQNFLIDDARGAANAWSDFISFFTGNPSERMGDRYYGSPPRGIQSAGPDMGRAGNAPRPSRRGGAEEESAEDAWLRYMRMAEQYMPGGRDWDAIEAALRANHSNSDAQIQAMYRALQGEIAESGERIGGYYDTAQERTNQVADETAGRMGAVRDMNRQQARDMLSTLGIEDSAAVNAAERAYDLPNAVGGVEARRQSALDSLIGNQAAGQRMTERIGQGAGFGEASRRSDLLQYLTRMLGDLEFGKSEEQAARQQALVNMAMGLRDAEASGMADQWKRELEAARLRLEMQKHEDNISLGNRKENRISFLDILDKTGGDREAAQEIWEIIQAIG